jgi:hypothetical protein
VRRLIVEDFVSCGKINDGTVGEDHSIFRVETCDYWVSRALLGQIVPVEAPWASVHTSKSLELVEVLGLALRALVRVSHTLNAILKARLAAICV